MTITKFSMEYDAVNSKNVFTNGDTLNGRIILQVSKDSRIRELVLLAMGEAQFRWNVDDEVFYLDREYYNIKHYILRESREDAPFVIGKGSHVFPFSFKFPDRNIPTSLKCNYGSIFHKLEVQVKQPKKRSRCIETDINFISKANVNIPRLMEPQHGSQLKTFRFGSGRVLMNVYLEHQAYRQGEPLRVTLQVNNLSSWKMRPRFVLYDELRIYTQAVMLKETNKILTERCDMVKPHRMETLTKVFNIPDKLTPSNLNCSLIQLHYWLKVYLDAPLAKSPRVKLHIVVLPSFDVPTTARPPAAAAAETFESRIQTQRMVQQASALPEEPPPAYEACVADPYPHAGGGVATCTGATRPAEHFC